MKRIFLRHFLSATRTTIRLIPFMLFAMSVTRGNFGCTFRLAILEVTKLANLNSDSVGIGFLNPRAFVRSKAHRVFFLNQQQHAE